MRGVPPESGQSRMVRSHDADAIVFPSGEIASETIGAVWPAKVRAGAGSPGFQIAILPSSPPVASRPSLRIATAFTALS